MKLISSYSNAVQSHSLGLQVPGIWQPGHGYKLSTICCCLFWAWLHLEKKNKLCSKAGFYQQRDQGMVSKCPKAPQDPSPPASPCSSVTGLRHQKGLVSERASGRIRNMRLLDFHERGKEVQFREDGGYVSPP